jgi:hypothetical protein
MELMTPACVLDLADSWRVAPKDEMMTALHRQGVVANLVYQ